MNNVVEWIKDIFLSFHDTSNLIEGSYLHEVSSDNIQLLYFFNKDKFCTNSICRIILDISYKDYEINITSTYTFMLNPKFLREQNINLDYVGANTYGETLNIDYIEDESDKDETEWKIETYAMHIFNDIKEKIEKIKPRIDSIVSNFNEVMSDRDYVVADSSSDQNQENVNVMMQDASTGMIQEAKNKKSYMVIFYINGKYKSLGSYPTRELANEVRQYFISINYDLDKFKESKYWKELRILGNNSEGLKGTGSIFKKNENLYRVVFKIKEDSIFIGNYPTRELAEEARQYFISINYDLDKFKESKYWKELRNIGANSKEYIKNGTIVESYDNPNNYKVQFNLNNKIITIGTYPTRETAEEARQYFISINYDLDKFKESKYWKELRNIGTNSKEYNKQGSISNPTYKNEGYKVLFWLNNIHTIIGTYPTKKLAEEARQYFISINYDLDKFKESKYWLEKTDRRQTSKNYWNNITMNVKNTSGVTGVSGGIGKSPSRWKCWESYITINNETIRETFYSKEAAIKFRQDLEKLGNEFNANHDQKRLEEQLKYIEERARNMKEEKTAKLAAEAYKKGLENPDGEDTTTWDSINDDDMIETSSNQNQENVNVMMMKNEEITTSKSQNEKFYVKYDSNTIKITNAKDEECGILWYKDGEIQGIRVNSFAQGKGLGEALMQEALKKGCYWLDANGRRAFKLYKKLGFVTIGPAMSEPIRTEKELEKYLKKDIRWRYSAVRMCLKSHLDKFGLTWNEFQQKVDEILSEKYKGQLDSKPKRRIDMKIGDSVNLKDGRVGIVEDYDDKFFYVRDNNANLIKIKKAISDKMERTAERAFNKIKEYKYKYGDWFSAFLQLKYDFMLSDEEIEEMVKRLIDQEEFEEDFGNEIKVYCKDSGNSKLSKLIGKVSTFTKNKDYDVLDFKKLLEENGFEVDYMENKSKTWQENNGEYYKDYDVVLKDGTRIFFRLIADKEFNSKEVIAYTNGKVKNINDGFNNTVSKFTIDLASVEPINSRYDKKTGEYLVYYVIDIEGNDDENVFYNDNASIAIVASYALSEVDIMLEHNPGYGYDKGTSIERLELDENNVYIELDKSDEELYTYNLDGTSFEKFAEAYDINYAKNPIDMINEAIKENADYIKKKFLPDFEDWIRNNPDIFLDIVH